jgi:hypothetical protein
MRASLISGGKVDVREEDGQVVISVPRKAQRAFETVVVLELDGSALDIAPR